MELTRHELEMIKNESFKQGFMDAIFSMFGLEFIDEEQTVEALMNFDIPPQDFMDFVDSLGMLMDSDRETLVEEINARFKVGVN